MPTATQKSKTGRDVLTYDEFVDDRLSKVRSYVKLRDLAVAAVLAITGALALLLTLVILDHWVFDLGLVGRLVGFAMLLGWFAYVTTTRLLPPLIKSVNPAYAAKVIEEGEPGLKNRILNFVLFRSHRDELKEVVYQAVREEAATELTQVEVESTVDYGRLVRVAAAMAALVMALSVYSVISPKSPFATVARVLFPWKSISRPSRVLIEDVEPGDAQAYFGRNIIVSAVIERLPADERPSLFYSSVDGRVVDDRLSMSFDETRQRYEVQLPPGAGGLRQDLMYRLEAGDAIAGPYRLRVVPAPSMVVERVEYEFPAYTQQAPEVIDGEGDIRAIEGTRVTVHASTNQTIASAYLEFDPVNRTVKSKRAVSRSRHTLNMDHEGKTSRARFTLLLRQDGRTPWHSSYQTRFHNLQDEINAKPIRYHIDVVPDLKPEVEVEVPRKPEVEVPLNSVQPIEVRAFDPDFQLTRLALQMVQLAGEGDSIETIDLIEEPTSGQTSKRYLFTPQTLGLQVGQTVVVKALAYDNRHDPNTGELKPNVATSGDYKLKIVEPIADDQTTPPESRGNPSDSRDPASDPSADSAGGEGEAMEDGSSSDTGEAGGEGTSGDQPGEGDPGQGGQAAREASDAEAGNNPSGGASGGEQSGGEQSGGEQSGGEQSGGEQSGGESSGGEPAGGEPAGGEPADSQPGGERSGDERAGGERSSDESSDGQPSGGDDSNASGDEAGGRDREGMSNGNSRPRSEAGDPRRSDSEGDGDPQGANRGADADASSGREGASDDQLNGNAERAADGTRDDSRSGEDETPLPSDGSQDADVFDRVLEQMRQQGESVVPREADTDSGDRSEQSGADSTNDSDPAMSDPGTESEDGNDGSATDGGEASDASDRDPQSGEASSEAQQGEDAQEAESSAPPNESQGGQPTDSSSEEAKTGESSDQANPQANQPGDQQGNEEGQASESSQTAEPSRQTSDQRSEQGDRQGGTAEGQSGQGQQGSGAQPGREPGGVENPDGAETGEAGEMGDGQQSSGEQGERGLGEEGQSSPQGQSSPGNREERSGEASPGDSSTEGSSQPSAEGSGEEAGTRGAPSGSAEGQPSESRGAEGETAGDQRSSDPSAADGETGEQSGEAGENAGENAGDQEGSSSSAQGQPDSQGGGQTPGGGTHRGDSDPAPGAAAAAEPGGDEANLEYANKATQLVLDHLESQRDEPDPELLERLGWTQDDLNRFLNRWDQMRRAAEQPGEAGERAREELDQALRSLGLEAGQDATRTASETADELPGVSDAGTRGRPPAQYRELYKGFMQRRRKTQ